MKTFYEIHLSNIQTEVFWKFVSIGDQDVCWRWQGYRNPDGYGIIKILGVSLKAHRVAWTITNGLVPKGMLVLHKCDNKGCCNPNHLYIGNQSDNMNDRSIRNPLHSETYSAHRTKFTEAEVLHIRKLRIITGQGGRNKYKISTVQVAKEFNVSHFLISKIWNYEKVLCKEGYYV